jgi:DNA repair protein RecN (Recombination protein N)
MLMELKVTNFAIIDSLQVSFRDGLNILSGETGAGKSVILKSLALLMGEKATTDVVRSGVETATIEGLFDLSKRKDILAQLEAMGLEITDDSLVVRRVLSATGKSKVYLNGSLSPLTGLRDIVAPLITVTGPAAPLIEMTGQHENRNLQSKVYHLELVDRYAGTWNLRETFETKFAEVKAIEVEMAQIEEASRVREQRVDFLRFQLDEIEALNLQPGEEVEIEGGVARVRSSQKLTEFVNQSLESLYSDEDAAMVRIHHVLSRGQELATVDRSLTDRLMPLTQAKALMEDCIYELREYGRNLEGQPEELDSLEERLSALRKLQKKFGATSEEILAAYQEMQKEFEDLSQSDERLKSLRQQKSQIEGELDSLAKELHKKRKLASEKLNRAVNEELSELNMKGVMFHLHVDWLDHRTYSGQSDIEFMIQSSKKDEPRSLMKAASGGELSRLLLSLKTVIGASELPRTYLFDEVDTGVSGQTAEKVGRKLKSIAQGQQVICVTHLPQVASFADTHFLIEKATVRGGGVKMAVIELNSEDRIQEIARLISGEKISTTSLKHAKQLLAETTAH